MAKATDTAAKLEAAKERLRASLTALEHAVEKKLKEAEKRAAAPASDTKVTGELKQKLEFAANENKMLKTENEKLAILHSKVSKRVEKLIEEMRQVVGK